MHAKIIAIGTSKGIRIPKYLLDKYQLEGCIDLDDTGSGILIRPAAKPRDGWAAAFEKVAYTEHDKLIDMPDPSWDEEEWEW